MVTATIADESGSLTCFWFNNLFKVQINSWNPALFCWKISINPKIISRLAQAVVESLSAETIHTGRIVPLYSQTLT
jgi:hypothetical protein